MHRTIGLIALLAIGAASAEPSPKQPPPRFGFTRNLTLGSAGADVAALQTFLEAKGFMVMPAGVPKGYFGPLLRAALAKYQQVRGIHPHRGYFGPITRAAVGADSAGAP